MIDKKTLKQFSDLRPNTVIECFSCRQVKPQQGSVKFRAHHVCQECVFKLKTKKDQNASH